MSTYLVLIQDFCAKHNLPNPSGVIGSTEATVRQLIALTHEVTEDLQKYKWPNQRIRLTWTGLVAEDQGTLTSIFGAGYRGLEPRTLWNTTQRREITGPITDMEYQAVKGLQITGSFYRYRIAEGKLWIVPALTAADGLSAVYTSIYGVRSTSNNPKERITADDDTFIYSDRVFKSSLEWKWLKQKGEAWATAKLAADMVIAEALNKDGHLPTLDMSGSTAVARPGLIVPDGSWNV